ncbi:MAG: glycosyltransferase [Bdellovibrionaceae bacterium]|nr:glycosyltransferase [Pseudobdellovibrionaceae bacterium]
MASIDIVIPVFNEGENIVPVLESFRRGIKTDYKVLICFDMDSDDTLPAVKSWSHYSQDKIEFVKNGKRGPHAAVLSGFAASTATAIMVYPADDDYNAGIVDEMFKHVVNGSDIVCASRFVPGGCMKGCPWVKALLVRVAAWTLFYIGRLPSRDATNGLRMFSGKLIKNFHFESTQGFTYSIEILVKAHRQGLQITDVPAEWHQRKVGQSRFNILKWVPGYLRWYFYAFATTYGFRKKNPLL